MKKSILFFGVALLGFSAAGHAQCAGAFYDSFESGSYTPTWTLGTGLTSAAVTTTSPAVGTYRVEGTGGTSTHLTGLSTSFTAATPTDISWYMNPQTAGASHNYFVAGNSAVSATNCIVFCYYQAAGEIRFVSSVTYTYACPVNSWYHIELRNINWSAHTFDIYINNVLQYTAFPFRNATQNDISRVHLYNFNSATGVWDDIRVGNQPPVVTASYGSPMCNAGTDGSINQTVTGGTAPFTFAWSNGATTEDLSSIAAGTYSVTVTDNIGCTATQTVVVTEPTAVTATTSQTNVSCFGGNTGCATVTPTGGTPGYTYNWVPAGGTSATACGLVAGCYTCVITDANGCTGVQTICITEPPALMAMATSANNNICMGDSTMLMGTAMGGTPNHTFNWLPGNLPAANPNVAPASLTTYTLEVTDANGCTATATTMVNVNSLPVVNLGSDTTVCGGVMLDAQNAGSAYTWSNGDTTQMTNANASGTYNVMVVDANGCMNMDTINVTVDAMPDAGTVMHTSGTDLCVGDTSSLISTGASGTIDWWVMPIAGPFWQYIGSGNPYSSAPPTSVDVGVYYFMAIASNGVCGPDSSNIITVEIHDLPLIQLSDVVACQSTVLDAQNAGSTYLWSTSDSTQTITVSASGMYSVIVTDMFGCVNSDTANVTINPLPNVSGNALSSVCADDADVVLTGIPSGGLWTGPSVTGTTFDPSIGAGVHVLTYTYTDSNSCTGNFNLSINVSACVGITEQNAVAVNVYPNPNNGTFTLQFAQASDATLIEITDVNGRVVKSEQLNSVSQGSTHEISMGDAASGIYMMRVTSGENLSVFRIVVQR